jgi:hypothetical protein
MIRTRIIACFCNLFSISAVAGYDCTMSLSHTENLYKTVATKNLTIKNFEMRSGHEGELFIEKEKKRSKTSLHINAFLNGYEAEEEAVIVVMRQESTGNRSQSYSISDKLALRGNDKATLWFDSYKLDVSCQLTKS